MVSKVITLRLDKEKSEYLDELKRERQLSSYITLLVGALMQDKVATTQFLLGLSDQSLANNRITESMIRANLYEKWLALEVEEEFESWVSRLNAVEVAHQGGLQLPLVDVKSVLLDLLDDLGLEMVEKGSKIDSKPVTSEVGSLDDLSTLVAQMVDKRLLEVSKVVSSSQGNAEGGIETGATGSLPVEEDRGKVDESVEAPVETHAEVLEELPVEVPATVSVEDPTENSTEEPAGVSVEVPSRGAEQGAPNVEVNMGALMEGLGL